MSVNGKNKGNTFERKISNMFSKRFKDVVGIDNSFRRNPDSGSFFGRSNQKRMQNYDTSKATFGDIIVPENFKFSIECKHYKDPPSFKSILSQNNKKWDEWIKQAEQDSINSSLDFMLIIKYNGIDEFVFLKNVVTDIKPIFEYKGCFAYALSTLVDMDNSFFFND